MTIQPICVHQCRNPAGSRLRIHVCPAGHTCLRPPEAQLWAPSSAVKNSRSLLNTLRSLRSLRCMIFLTAKGAKISSVCLVDEYSNKNVSKTKEITGHREKQQISVLSLSSVVDYPCSTSIDKNTITRDLNN